MNGVIQMDLFATKGIEYLVVIGFLAFLTLAWRLVGEPGQAWTGRAEGRRPVSDWRAVLRGIGLPESEFLFHPGHAWARLASGDGVATIGWDDFARRLIGPPDEFHLPNPGTSLSAGEPGWSVGLQGRALSMLAPVDGEVLAVNDAVVHDPSLASRDPYGEGWLLRVRVPSTEVPRRNLLAGSLARSWAELGERSLQGLAADAHGAALGAVLADGGEPRAGLARTLAPERWEEVVNRLLLIDTEVEVGAGGSEAEV
ncbi:MAG: glycine cleavage system protein H [Gemmatimonadota bacterium]